MSEENKVIKQPTGDFSVVAAAKGDAAVVVRDLSEHLLKVGNARAVRTTGVPSITYGS